MRKLIALALIMLAVAGGFACVSVEKPTRRSVQRQQRLLKPPPSE
jgi:hypothetical protein